MDSAQSPVSVRPIEAEDAAHIVAMAHELAAAVDDPAPSLEASDLLRDSTGPERWFDCLVALAEGQPIGYATLCRGYEAHTGKRRLWLGDLYVRPQARRLGAGRALMTAIAEHAAALGCDAIYWELWRQNAAGRAFYQKLGAVESGEIAVWRLTLT